MITDEQRQELSAMPYWNDYLCFPQPCWHNIFPGKTKMDDVLAIIQADANLRISGIVKGMLLWARVSGGVAGGLISPYSDSTTVAQIFVNESDEQPLYLNNALLIYGTPLALHYCFSAGLIADGIYVYFQNSVVARVYDRLHPLNREIYPNSPIVQMEYSVGDVVPTEYLWAGYSEPKPSQ